MTKVALLGGAGQIASELANYLARVTDYRAVALCRNDLVAAPLRFMGCEVRVFSTASAESIRSVLDDVEIVIDCSFAPVARLSDDEQLRTIYGAILTAPGVQYFVHLSSIAVYGEVTASDRTSFENPVPDTVYGAQKLHTENLVRRLSHLHSKRTLIARLGHVYGGTMAWSTIWNALLCKNALDATDLQLPSNAIHIRQLCQGIVSAIERRTAGTWNLIGAPNTVWAEVLDWHLRALALTDPSLPAGESTPALSLPRRTRRRGLRMGADACKIVLGAGRGALAATPAISQAIRLMLARHSWLPSVDAVKDTLGGPGIEAFFGASKGEEFMYIFDSLPLTEPFLHGPEPLTEDDFNAQVATCRMMLVPRSLDEYIDERLGSRTPER